MNILYKSCVKENWATKDKSQKLWLPWIGNGVKYKQMCRLKLGIMPIPGCSIWGYLAYLRSFVLPPEI